MGLKEMREATGMSQKDAAALFGFYYRTYQNYENGVTSPTMDDAARLARHFNCTIGDLFDLEEGMKQALTDDEQRLLSAYRSIDTDLQAHVLSLMEALGNPDAR